MDLRRLAQNVSAGDRARQRMARTGMSPNGHPLWIPPEKHSLASNHPDYNTALAEIKRRTRPAAHSKASRMGITKPAPLGWDAERDIPRLRRLYPTSSRADIEAAFPERTWSAICAKARQRHIYRERRIKPTGLPLLDQILARAIERNMSLWELDESIGRGRYFSVAGHRRHIRPIHLALAVTHLGGILRARFPK
jgi:hypothetical protein